MPDNAQEMFNIMQENVKDTPGIVLPPPVFLEFGGEILETDLEAKTLKARYPNLPKHRNPIGYLQGGVLVVLMDNTAGPLSFLVAPPSVTVQFNTSYMRPVTPEDEYIYVTATVTDTTRRQLYITVRATNVEGKPFAIGHTVSRIIGE